MTSHSISGRILEFQIKYAHLGKSVGILKCPEELETPSSLHFRQGSFLQRGRSQAPESQE